MENEKKCPICGKNQDEKYKPFCSKKCADVLLPAWVAQLVEQGTENPCVGGSIPSPGTSK